eukprot:7190536-Prymnesium_polylepis.1
MGTPAAARAPWGCWATRGAGGRRGGAGARGCAVGAVCRVCEPCTGREGCARGVTCACGYEPLYGSGKSAAVGHLGKPGHSSPARAASERWCTVVVSSSGGTRPAEARETVSSIFCVFQLASFTADVA